MRFFCLVSLCMIFFAAVANANVTAVIDKSAQTMTVYQDGVPLHQWPVSTGLKYGWTKNGTFGVQSMRVEHYSSLYNNAPMPWSVFFNGNIATHGTTELDKLGTMASKGCVRLHPDNARILFMMIKETGPANTTIIVQD